MVPINQRFLLIFFGHNEWCEGSIDAKNMRTRFYPHMFVIVYKNIIISFFFFCGERKINIKIIIDLMRISAHTEWLLIQNYSRFDNNLPSKIPH